MEDTIELLKKCGAGADMGVKAVDEIIKNSPNISLKKDLEDFKKSHQEIYENVRDLLIEYGEKEAKSNPIADGMSFLKTNMKMLIDDSASTIASLMVDGCNMGVKALTEALNKYIKADEESKNICIQLITLEDAFGTKMRDYL